MLNPWDAIARPSNDVSARRADPSHDLDLFWARDHLGRYLFFIELPPETDLQQSNLPALVGIQLRYMEPSQTSPSRLLLVLKERDNWEIFLALCNDLIHATCRCQNVNNAVQTILRRLGRWQEFLKKQRLGLLSEEEIKGLLGELLFLRDSLIPIFGAPQAVTFWQGPDALPQDFNVNDCAVEVKCQSGVSQPTVRISSVEQLCPQLPEMYLQVITLGRTSPDNTEALNLPLLVKEIRKQLDACSPSALERFGDLLYMAGYIDSDDYLDFSYLLANQVMYRVADGFPRICKKDLPAGVVSIAYSISLAECAAFKEMPTWLEMKQ